MSVARLLSHTGSQHFSALQNRVLSHFQFEATFIQTPLMVNSFIEAYKVDKNSICFKNNLLRKRFGGSKIF